MVEKYLVKIIDNLTHGGCLLKHGKIIHANDLFRTAITEEALGQGLRSRTEEEYSCNIISNNLFMNIKKIKLDNNYDLIFLTKAKDYNIILDPLTKVLHRECLELVTSKIVEEAKLVNKIIVFMFLDLDGFKAVNDTFGHDSGDLVLQETAHRISSIIRNDDICIRLGGDEFLVILTEIKDKMHSCLVARRLICGISQPIILEKNTDIKIGVSIGISSYPSDGLSVEELMNKSDEAMYKAKKLGKNNYQLYQIGDQ